MWPWEHALFAYIFYSLYVRARHRETPDDWPVVALVGGSLFPDLIDKPLAWQFDVFESGYAVAHSVFVAVPIVGLIYVITGRTGHRRSGIAFGIGYLLHLVGDVLPRTVARGELYLDPITWPYGNPRPDHHESLLTGFIDNLWEYLAHFATLDITPVVALQLGVVFIGTILWIIDGFPGLRLFWRKRRIE